MRPVKGHTFFIADQRLRLILCMHRFGYRNTVATLAPNSFVTKFSYVCFASDNRRFRNREHVRFCQ